MKLNLKLFIVLAVIFNANIALSQAVKNKDVQFLVDTTITIMKANAVNTNKVDWAVLKQNALRDAVNINNPYQLGDVMRNLYKSLNDFHGKFTYRDSSFQWHGKDVPVSDSVKKEWSKRSGIKTALLDNNIGYLRIPSIGTDTRAGLNKKAQNLNDSLCSVLTPNTKGMILDLRINGGGDMHPMILGVEQLLGQGKVGSFQVKANEYWSIKGNSFLVDTAITVTIIPKCVVNGKAIPVVVLIGPGTGSSGEFLAMAFKGREKTVFIGTETAGYVTSTNGFPVKNIAFILLSVGYGRDRNGKSYTNAIQPDIPLTRTDNFNDFKNDEKVKAAINWLNKNSK